MECTCMYVQMHHTKVCYAYNMSPEGGGVICFCVVEEGMIFFAPVI